MATYFSTLIRFLNFKLKIYNTNGIIYLVELLQIDMNLDILQRVYPDDSCISKINNLQVSAHSTLCKFIVIHCMDCTGRAVCLPQPTHEIISSVNHLFLVSVVFITIPTGRRRSHSALFRIPGLETLKEKTINYLMFSHPHPQCCEKLLEENSLI